MTQNATAEPQSALRAQRDPAISRGRPQQRISMDMKTEGICEMCGYHVGVRQKAHILAEGKKTQANVLMLCPTCHVMFDTHVKPKIFKTMIDAGLEGFPESWRKSIYEQAAEASAKALKKKEDTEPPGQPDA
jgi:hypothetical protein